jgi:ABC-type amino acid transport substrate-binding protein
MTNRRDARRAVLYDPSAERGDHPALRRLARIVMRAASLVFVLLATLTALGPAEARDWKRIRVATDGAYPPFSRLAPGGSPIGFDVDVATAICARLGAECEIVATGWDGLLPALETRNVDLLVASQPITEEARRRVAFTAKYHQISPRFVARDLSTPVDPAPAATKGRRIGVRAGTAHAAYLAAVHVPKGATVLTFPTEADALKALAGDRLDLVFGDALALYDWLDLDPAGRCCRFVGKPVESARWFGAGAGIAYRPEDRDLGALVDKALVGLDRDGTLDRLVGRHFPFAIR